MADSIFDEGWANLPDWESAFSANVAALDVSYVFDRGLPGTAAPGTLDLQDVLNAVNGYLVEPISDAISGRVVTEGVGLLTLTCDPVVFQNVAGNVITSLLVYLVHEEFGLPHPLLFIDSAVGLPFTPDGTDLRLTFPTDIMATITKV